MRRSFAFLFLAAILVSSGTQAASRFAARPTDPNDHEEHRRLPLVERFQKDPRDDRRAVETGAVAERLSWEASRPAWPGDAHGSLTALYDSSLAPALFGLALPESLDQDDAFTAAATFVIDPDGFYADPFGFFQISWGLWNRSTTGLERTGSFASFAGDTFELLEFDYFPNVTPDFGGPFLAPSLFGRNVNPAHPDSFLNATFTFGAQTELPLGVPLLAVIEHDPELGVAVVSVHRIVKPNRTLPVLGAVAEIDLSSLPSRAYALDVVGVALWNDGFGGPTPALHATVHFHSLVVRRGLVADVDSLLKGH